VLAKTFY